MNRIPKGMASALAVVALSAVIPETVRAEPETVRVECAAGQTIARALRRGEQRKPLTVVISGTCNETVIIDRDDVTLTADSPGAIVRGLDPNVDTITVTGSRVTLLGLTVTGGRTGIVGVGARNMLVKDCTVENADIGIVILQGTNGTVDGCTVQGNARFGVQVVSASAVVINSVVTLNGNVGVNFADGASGRIGITLGTTPGGIVAAGNAITNNGGSGINLSLGASAFIGANTISGNGTNPTLGRFGISVINATADIIGGNSITGNAAHGILASSAKLNIGNLGFSPLTPVNTITGNGTATFGSGLFATLGTTAVVREAIISANNGSGLFFNLRSSLQLSGNTTIQNNTGFPAGFQFNGDGIRLVMGSALSIDMATFGSNTITGNAGWALNCLDPESSVSPFPPALPVNGLGGVNPSCTPF